MPINIPNLINRLLGRELSAAAKLNGKLEFSGDLTLRGKHSFSRQHFSAAKFFSAEATRIEGLDSGASAVESSKHRAYVTGAILSAVAALEASINELYLEAKDKNKTALTGLTDDDFAELESEWKNVEPISTLEKYQEALRILGKREFDRGKNPFQEADSLIYLRNALVHYKPEWDNEALVHAKIKKRLKNKFVLNAFSSPSSLWFPHQCLGAGCAEWSVTTTRSFVLDFCKRMGIANRL